MIKKLSVFVALMALFFTDLALAASAAVTAVTGTAQVQTGTSAPRTLRQGDEVSQGDTVVTGANSSVVLKFDDGQVAALTANSRMVISAYSYNPANESGNVLLSLVSGGMRAITGLIGRRSPNQVAYRAATATIGIRGTDTTMATDGTNVVVTVSEGSVTYSFGGVTLTISAGEAVFSRPGQAPIRGTIAQVLPQTPQAIQNAVNNATSGALNGQIGASGPGQPRQGGDQQQGQQGQSGTQTPGGTGTPAGGGAGGGQASGS
jgi:hypothetical protein